MSIKNVSFLPHEIHILYLSLQCIGGNAEKVESTEPGLKKKMSECLEEKTTTWLF